VGGARPPPLNSFMIKAKVESKGVVDVENMPL